jgi:hypothetical protein
MDTDSVSNMPINDSDPDSSPGENADDDWIDTGSVFNVPVGDITEEVTELYPGASKIYGRGHTFMDTFDSDTFSLERQHNLYYPFSSKTEWKFALWLANSGLSMAAIGECLLLDIVHVFSLPAMSADGLPFRLSHNIFRSEQQKHFENLLNCSLLGPGGSISPSKPNHLLNLVCKCSIETPLNAFNTSYIRRLTMERLSLCRRRFIVPQTAHSIPTLNGSQVIEDGTSRYVPS